MQEPSVSDLLADPSRANTGSASSPPPPSPAPRRLSMSRADIVWLLLLAVSTLVTAALSVWAIKRHDVALFIYGRVSYWLIFALLGMWTWQVVRFLRERQFSPVAFLKAGRVPLIAALVMTAIAVTSVPSRFQVLSDETNLLSVSQSMLHSKTAYNSPQQKHYFGLMHPIDQLVEKRPLVFPFLVQVIHTVRGYSPSNPFVLNAIVLFTLLALVGLVTARVSGHAATVAAVLLVGSYPLIVTNANSGGFDLLATLFTALSFLSAFLFMKDPGGRRLVLLVATLLVFVHIRYESSVTVAIIGVGLLAFGHIRWRFIREHLAIYSFFPVLLLPLIVQRILTPQPYENAPGTPAFSWAHFEKFTGIFAAAQRNTEFLQPHAPLLYWLAIPIVVLLLVKLLQKQRDALNRAQLHFSVILGVALVVSHGIFFSYYAGDFTHPSSARFFLNLSLVVAVLPVLLHMHLPRWVSGSGLLAFAVSFALLYHPVSVQARFPLHQTILREAEFEWAYLKKHADPNALVITSRPGQFTVMNQGAVDFDYANTNRDALLNELHRHLYSDVLVFQRIAYGPGEPSSDKLHAAFKLEKLAELQSSAYEFVRISRVRP